MKKNTISFFRCIKQCLSIIYKYDNKYLFTSVFISICQGITPSISLLISQKIINNMQTNSSITNTIKLLIVYLFINMIPSIVYSFYNNYRVKFQKRFEVHISVMSLKKSLTLNLKDFEDDSTYDMINRAQSQKGFNIIVMYDNIIAMIREFISIISLIALLSQFKVWLILIVIIVPILRSVYSIVLSKEGYDISINRTWKERKAMYIDNLLMRGYAFKEIKLFRVGNKIVNHYKDLKNEMLNEDFKIIKKSFIADTIATVIDNLVFTSITAFIIVEGLSKKILIGDVTSYIQATQSIKSNVESIFSLLGCIIQDVFYTDLLFQFLNYKNDENEVDLNTKLESHIEKIELINVSYKYGDSSEYALKDINLVLEKGNPVALLGRNGSGKTTLLKIILGFYDDYEGTILVNGINLRNIQKDDYIQKISCMFQDYIKYEGTIKENVSISIFNESNIPNKVLEKVQETKLKTQIYEKDGIDTMLGTWFGKKQISMGEWQKIAIARALIKNADIYIFDEPDASLDPTSANEIINLYKNAFKDKIGIIITHKIRDVKKITKNIIVLDRGEIAERGCHEELIVRGEVYSNLFYNCD